MKKNLLIVLLISLSLGSFAQQESMYTHYMYNTLAVNPAYAGSRNLLTVTALHRSQWVGFAGAPITQTLTFHSPIYRENLGLGGSFSNDIIGPLMRTTLNADFSYKIRVSKKAKLGFGLKGGLSMVNANLSALKLYEDNDQVFQQDINSKMLPNFGFGMYYYTSRFYAGLSIPKLLKNNFIDNTISGSTNLAGDEKHYFFIAGAVFDIADNVKLKPTVLGKVTSNAPVQGDITAEFLLYERFRLGAMYRSGDAFGALLGINITKQLQLGYSFDWSYGNETLKYNNGSHEIMLLYDFNFKADKTILSPRYF